MKNFQQTPKQKRLVFVGNKAAHTLSKKPGRTYAQPWDGVHRVGQEPVERLARFDHTSYFRWY